MPDPSADPRLLSNGLTIPSESYADQPYVVVRPDGSWLCTLTTAAGHEGEAGQHIVALRSEDKGQSWTAPVALEPPDGPEASWAVPLHVPHIGGPSGRVYVFYVYNRDNVRTAPCSQGETNRVDTLGSYVFRYSDDGGCSWSRERHEVPVREFAVDRANASRGRLRYFWGVAKPVVHQGRVYIPLHKVGDFGAGFMRETEGCFVISDNILYETDPYKLRWETTPDGEVGLRSPEGNIAEEHSIVGLSDGSLFCVWRTVAGYPACAYSRDAGHTWTPPAPLKDGSGRPLKHPRAANFVWKCSNGRFLYWFHNHGLKDYSGRNPVWLCGGQEADGPDGHVIAWGQPEVLLYDDDAATRISYPDLIEDDGRLYVTETQKTIARVHEIPPRFLAALWNQSPPRDRVHESLAWEMTQPGAVAMPPLQPLATGRGGFTLEMRLRFASLTPWQTLFDSRDESGRGLLLQLTDRTTLKLSLCGTLREQAGGGIAEAAWECDSHLLRMGASHHVAVVVDGGPKQISWVIDGSLNDGGAARTHGWGRFLPSLENVNGAANAQIAPHLNGDLAFCRFYIRVLLFSEIIAHVV